MDVARRRPGLLGTVESIARGLGPAAARQLIPLITAEISKSRKRTKSQKGKKSKKSKKSGGVVFPQSDALGKFKVSSKSRVKRPKKTLSDKVRSIQKQIGSMPKDTTVHYTNTIPYVIGAGSPNELEIVEIPGITHLTYDNALTSVNGFDYTTATGNQVQIKSCVTVMEFQNFGNTAITVKYQWVKCVDSGPEGPIDNIIEEAANRGNAFGSAAGSSSAADQFSAAKPRRLFVKFAEGEQNSQIFGVQTNKWKPISAVTRTRMGPSDLLKVSMPKKAFLWKNEWFVNDPATHMPGDVYLLASFAGDYQKNSVTDTNLISKSAFDVICSRFVSCKATVADKQGLRIHNYNSEYDSSNVNLPQAIVEEQAERKTPLG